MMNNEQTDSLKRYYSISEVAHILTLQPSQIRFWEKEFDLLNPRKDRKGNRMFTVEDMNILKTIYHLLKERGLTIEGAKPLLKMALQETEKKQKAIGNLKLIKKFLVNMRNQLEEFEEPSEKNKISQPTLF